MLTIALFCGCASAPPVEEELPSAEGYYQSALEMLEGSSVFFGFRDVDYQGAIELFQEVIDNYPYSEYATLAELKIADVHFERGNYEEAASFYQDFVELHPTHAKVPYSIYRNGMCAFRQMRATDQDQTPTREAIAQFEVLLERYPATEDAPLVREHLQRARDQLAAHDVAVGDFYFDRGHYYAAIRRYREAITAYPGHSQRARTLARLGIALKRLHRYYEAERVLHQVLTLEPEDDETLDRARAELDELRGIVAGDGVRPLPRSCVTDPNPSCAGVPPTED